MSTLYITRGLQGSGKTTRARAWVAEDPGNRVRVNRDDLRKMIDYGRYLGTVTESRIVSARNALVSSFLKQGKDVVVDDTNLRSRMVKDLMRLATRAGAKVEIWDMTDVPLETCIARDRARQNPVGEEVIRDYYNAYVRGKGYPLPLPEQEESEAAPPERYVPKPGAPKAALVDIDGTVAKMNGRSPYDYSRVSEDLPNRPIIDLVRTLYFDGYTIVFVSGRPDSCRSETLKWLSEHVNVYFADLLMRKAGDYRKDAIVKLALFDRYIRDRYDVRLVLDDRNQVVEMWRSLGLTCLQVAEGDF